MKIKHLFGLAVIAAMTASCSSNEDLGTAGPSTGTNETGVGYATFTINLPSVSGSRAAGDPTMEEGDENEYAVKSATALIFQKYGADEGSYKFVESVTLPTAAADWSDDTTDGITTTSKKLVAKLTNVDTKNQYSVLVLLNNDKTGGVKVGLPTVGQSYNDWNKKVLTPSVAELAASGDFYMANAPLNGTASPTTLVNIDNSKIYPTEEKAKTLESAATVFVERGVAKISVPQPAKKTVKDKATKADTKSSVEFSNWALDITNKKTYAVHNIDGLSTDFSAIWTTPRFIGTNSRVYWGKDPNYNNKNLKLTDKDAERQAEFNFITATSDINLDFGKSTYCLENTFNLENMYQGQTTRVIFKAKYEPKDADGSLADADGTFYTIGNMTTILKEADLETAVNAVANPVLPTGYTIDYTKFKTEEGSHVITLADIKNASGTPLVAGTDYSGKKGEDIVADINTKLGLTDGEGRAEAMVGINTYLKGVTYYIARVKHFGDDKTSWSSGSAYDGHNDKYLGRYGMLRNNWYELNVGNVYGPGYPGVPPVDPTLPDDENEKYLSVSVKILSWAKWSHSYDL
ncbi:Mfa1 family fimbria major subunit [Prevotella copri]|uniref:Mfa1 family fimbria major subunit n=1 Tax=Segatella copri TaxID=165179 RepID=A0AAW4NE92_9BACT|nr:Mfa1 family fimbria major subunit [Segatella copri]MBU9911755.1 Mfa1 family fimbria major subunit [Segatella copri]MBV3399470.1 Mfa1 family fimbria major subunit [Segatella copri]MBV3409043.1 Mfa1 family fimbria major subunit [Segatella copri]MBV3411915.1 Mfa1 family fimbria major subunit [Segatella copri]MBV3420412.1 Mfa1 family fimbria major subunit [Segatella copri]